jgi:hypothetical protein
LALVVFLLSSEGCSPLLDGVDTVIGISVAGVCGIPLEDSTVVFGSGFVFDMGM